MRAGLCVLGLGLLGCVGNIGDAPPLDPKLLDGDGPDGSKNPTTDAWSFPAGEASVTIRRLSRRELGNAVEALIGSRPDALGDLSPDKDDLVYDRVVEAQTVSSQHEEGFAKLADEIATLMLGGGVSAIVPSCVPVAVEDDGPSAGASLRPCAEAFVDAIAPRAFRRPLDVEARDALLALYDEAESFHDGLRQVVHGILRSPHFLYLVEIGEPIEGEPGARALTSHEMAARLSFGLCETVPDAELVAAADSGALTDPEEVAAQAARLFDLPCAKETIGRLWAQWLRLDEVPQASLDPTLFPEFDAELAVAMQAESQRFLDHLTWEGDGSLRDVFAATFSILEPVVAGVYGVPVAGDDPQKTELPPERRGILTHPSLLTLTSEPVGTSPVRRGVFVLKRVLCGELPPPPQDANVTKPPPDPNATTRERWEAHSADPVCKSCHQFIDPVGFAMEDFDAMGRHRTMDNGFPVDASGGVPWIGIAPDALDGAAELSMAIAETKELRICFTRQWLRFALGRLEAESDSATAETMFGVLAESGTLKDALITIASSDSFRRRAAEKE